MTRRDRSDMEANKTTWRDGLPWLEDVAAGAVDAGVEAVRLDTWELMGAVAQAVVAMRRASEEAERLGVAYAERVAERRRLAEALRRLADGEVARDGDGGEA